MYGEHCLSRQAIL